MFKLLSKFFDSNDKQLKKAAPIVKKVNELEEKISKLSDEKLLAKTAEFRKRLNVDIKEARKEINVFNDITKETKKSELADERASLMEILPEAFAVVREASKRVANHRHFDVQVTAGYFLFTNKIIELFTGEGKTLAANLPSYLYALTGKGAHLVTVNDYLARRDAEWNGHILNALGMKAGAVNNSAQYRFVTDEEAIKIKGDEAVELIKKRDEMVKKAGRMKYDHMTGVNLVECTKKEVYECDVVYGTNNEFGFDYLRDNMVKSMKDRVQGPLHFAIIDEADSILIDEARTPLIISQGAERSNELYRTFAKLVRSLKIDADYTVDEKAHAVALNDDGIDKVEKMLGVKNIFEDPKYAYYLENALKAKELYKKDDEYIVKNGEVLIVDEFTGRVLQGRRYSEGLHQAIEAKEAVEVKRESRTLATITLQNYFRLYDHLAGMTGTALTESEEFARIYNLDVMVIPTNKPVVRQDDNDVVFRSEEGKFKGIVDEVKLHHEKGQPVLVGTTSVEKSERLSEMLEKEGIPHNVLNAKHHEQEARIVSDAGKKGAVTIATNMAGRGTDIGLDEGVKELGGLYVIGSERHEARRIDNQLRGRSGRQGDPGKSRFYISFEDDLVRLFAGSDRIASLLGKIDTDGNVPVSLGMVGKTIERAQKAVEAQNFDIRKRLVEYDDVLNQQREIIYGLRRWILSIIEKGVANPEPPKKPSDVKINVDALKDLDIDKLCDDLASLRLRHEETLLIPRLEPFEGINKPVNNWLLKKLVEHVKGVISVQLADDMQIDNAEERKAISLIQSVLGEGLIDIVVKLLGHESAIEFYRDFDKESDVSKKEKLLVRLAVGGFIFHASVLGEYGMFEVAKALILQSIDYYWMEHLDTMSALKDGISMRSIAQRDPLVDYKNEGFRIFDEMLALVDEAIVNRLFKVTIVKQEAVKEEEMQEIHEGSEGMEEDVQEVKAKKVKAKNQTVTNTTKVGRNDPCPCGSGKKYKKCHYPEFG